MVKQFRLEKGWSQEQLAQISGLNIRTIQRIESGGKAGLETLKALAAVFDVSIHQLQQEPPMEPNNVSSGAVPIDHPQKSSLLKSAFPGFYVQELFQCVVLIAFLFGVNLLTDPSYLWAAWPALGISFGYLMSITVKRPRAVKGNGEE